MSEPLFLDVQDVEYLHASTIHRQGGADGLRDRGLLESAVSMPRQQFGGTYLHAFPAGMAAAYLFHLAKNHAFVDGNKRVALMAALAFLRANGQPLAFDPLELEKMTLAVAASQMSKDDLIVWFEKALSK